MTSIPIDPVAARQWCERLARVLPRRDISPNGQLYLQRFYCAGWRPDARIDAPSLLLHRFVASDPDHAVHSHPWAWAMSLILVGGYRETRCLPNGTRVEREYYPGDVNVILATDRHRIELLDGDCWTLFLAGPFLQQWSFHPVCEA
jgi:hypothetical protein